MNRFTKASVFRHRCMKSMGTIVYHGPVIINSLCMYVFFVPICMRSVCVLTVSWSAHTSLALLFPAQFCPYYSSLLLFRLSTNPIEATMNFIILQPNDRHRTVDIESDSTFGVAMDAAAMRGRCDDDGWSIERTLQRRSSRLRGQILRESCSSEYMPMALDGRSA